MAITDLVGMVEKKKAMVIAVSKYDDGLHELDFCENDGKDMYKVLSSQGYEIEEKNVLIGQVNGMQMRDSILDFFYDHTTRSNDVVLFYYTGHGVPDQDTVYLASSDTNPSFPNRRGFSYDELRTMMNRCISTKVVTILDSCYSGSARLGKGADDASALATQLISKGGGVSEEGKCILAASQSYQEAYSTKEGDHSLFTHYLIKGLEGDREAADQKGRITPDTLGRYVYDKVTTACPTQKPIRKVEASGDIILATIQSADESAASVSFDVNKAIEDANNFFALGEYDKAISQYNLALQHDPRNTTAWNNKGKVYEKLIMYQEALECLDRAIAINVKDYVLWYNKGNVLSKLNRFSDALQCYDAAIRQNSKDPACWKNKSYVLSKLGRNSEAEECFRTANSLSK